MNRTPLKQPSALQMSRLSDRLTFLYVDKCRVEQDDNGTHTRVETDTGVHTTYLPVATLACLLLGPGTSITSPAATALAKHGCALVFTGAGVVRSYSTVAPLSGSTKLLLEQARAVTDEDRRLEVAKRMYAMRFPDAALPPEVDLGVDTLRGLEGARMRAFYQAQARRHRLSGWKRRKDGDAALDPVNEALNYANTALYGVCLATVTGLGMSPGLGIIHQGNPRAFVLDIADLYKTELTIPIAFRQAKSNDAGRDVMFELRDNFRLLRFLPRIVDDIHGLFGAETEINAWDVNDLQLWGGNDTTVTSGFNHDLRRSTRG